MWTINTWYLIFRRLNPNAEDYTFFPCIHGIFLKIEYMLSHKISLRTNLDIHDNEILKGDKDIWKFPNAAK